MDLAESEIQNAKTAWFGHSKKIGFQKVQSYHFLSFSFISINTFLPL